MKRSTDRIITSHAGSLYGMPALLDLMKGQRPGTAPGPEHAALEKSSSCGFHDWRLLARAARLYADDRQKFGGS